MAVLTLGHGLVLILVAEGTGKFCVLGLAGGEQGQSLLVTSATGLVRGGGGVGNNCRHVGLVALLAVGCRHFSGMGFVALDALRYLPMDAVTDGAGEERMLTFIFSKLGDLRGVAGKTWVGQTAGKGDGQRGMGVFVTVQTACRLVVGFSRVAVAAFGNVLRR